MSNSPVDRPILKSAATRPRNTPLSGEEWVEIQYQLSVILTRHLTDDQGVRKALELVCQSLDWQIGEVWVWEPRIKGLVCEEVWAEEPLEDSEFVRVSRSIVFEPGVGLPGTVWKAGNTVPVPELREFTNFPRWPVAEKAGLVSALGLPLWMGDSIVGVVEFFSKTRRELPSRELTLMAGLANQLAVFLSCLQGQGEGREKSEHLDLALRAANMGSWEWDIEANKVQWSENLEEIHGRLTGSFPGTFEAFQEDIAPEDRERVLTAIQQALSGEPYDIDYRIIRPDGLLRWLAAKGAVIKNRSGRPQKMIGVCMDITERKESEIRLQESEARTRAMLESALDAIITIDGKGQILEFNPAAEAILGFSRDEVTERELAELIIPERFQERHRRALSRLLSSTNGASAEEDEEESLLGRRVEMIVRRADGREIPVELAITRVESQGQPLYTGFLRDISAQKEAAEALKVRLKQNEIVAELGRKALGGMGLEELLDETVRAVAQGLQVEFAKVLQLQPDGKSFLVKAGVGWRDGVVGNAIVEANRDTQAGYTLFSGGPIIEDDLTVETRFRGNPILRNHGVRSGVTVIIESKGHPFGILGAHTAEVRAFSENDVHFLQTVANTLAQAIDRDRFERERNQLLLQELNARRQLEDALKDREVALQLRTSVEERLGLLVEASEELIGSLDVAKVLHVISDLSSRLVSADAVALWQLDNEASKWQIVFSRGFSLNYPKGAVRAAGPVVTEPVFIENLDRDDSIVPEERRRILKEERIRSLMILPLRVRGENTGTLIFYYRTPRRFMEMEMRVGSALANLAASALTASELYEEQRRLRQAADEARRRAAFVAEASAVLSSSLNYDITLDRLAKLFVPFLGDWCAVTMEEGSSSRRVAIVHSDPAKVRLARKMQERYPGKITPEVLETGKPQLYQEITDELLRSFAYDEEHLRLLEQLDLQSALIVPLRTRGRAIGTITVATAESRRMLSEKELSLVEEIADRAALAVDNARLFREAQRAQAELQAANEAKDEFLGLISHELRSPITVIYGGARMLSARADKLDRESKLSIVNDIEQESERLYRVVEDLLALAKAELGHSAGLGAVSIEGIVNKVVGSFKQRRPHREIQIHALRGLPPVKGEEVYVEQVLRNLLSNSDKYSPPESPIEINARVGDEGNAVLVSVLDRGHGITEEEIDKIFERFYRAKSTSRQAKGIGIGLTVCRRLIETLGGSIWAEPRDGGGLIVSFSLPVLRE